MRTLTFWSGIVCAFLCGLVDPAWGYAAVFVLSLVQIALLGSSGGSVFLLIHYATMLTYFSLAPAMQIANDVDFWETGVLTTASHTQALVLLLLYMAGVEAARFGMADTPVHQPGLHHARAVGVAHPFLLLLSCSFAAFATLFIRPDLNFVARGMPGEDDSVPIDFIVFSTLPKLVVLMCFVALTIHAFRRRTPWAWASAGLALALAAVAANPVNTARQILLIGLLPLFIHALSRLRHWRWALAGLIFGAIAALGPVLNLFSRGSMWGEGLTTFPFSQDFDAMFVVGGILERAPIPDLGWGRYLLSAFSFFLPRDLKMFPDFDPLGWSAILGNFSQSNLSLPPFTTAYFDFGLMGPLLLGIAISAVFRLIDRAIDPQRALSGRYLAALVLLSAYVPFMRGPILGWGPFAASGLIAAVIAGALSARARRVIRVRRTRTLPPSARHDLPTP
ncbi:MULTISPECIES: hypothetical protein [Variovorax]|jgi:hypothetical protein|uniref:hypothetical protein n=1 Tax=Variovorax TaxID=34072 RepID=UPI00086C7497|nr:MULTISPECIES: hypothetical protein [Variovorax]MBN8751869.1 hypothetical protein [Variovorax sp.]ODU17690.1 MAG: hypothetical protein ABS94_07185 [Variovorax sp. SCN 67-85]ODV27047.1 MAG: hypothetical protein ABT25_02540 [Variovorax sp. SCN 67-20]OJZ09298.1 MAG: hypothetical protein BGP22_35925 [Variovorax sp. 67-131]UKI04875.1 hypothetical protein L3V85_18650 [Variovorax paradoxus]